MALRIPALALAGALAVTTALSPAPARAADLPATPASTSSFAGVFDHSRFDPSAATADWRCRGWRCGRRGWGHRGWGGGWRRNRVDAGDVLIGAAILGGAIAIANSNNRRERQRDVVIVDRDIRDDSRRYDDRRYDDRPVDRRSAGSSGLESAVDQCVRQIERDVRVDGVDNVQRTGRGWLVSGALFNGSPFLCRIGNDGRIEGIEFGGNFSGGYGSGLDDGDWGGAPANTYGGRAEGQWSDTRYADARLAMGGMAQPQAAAPQSFAATPAPAQPPVTDRMPAYPGGPIPGEDIPETIDGDL